MTRAVPGAAGAVLLAVALGGCPGEIDPSLLNMNTKQCGQSDADAIFNKYLCNQAACHGDGSMSAPAAGFKMAPSGWQSSLVGGQPVAGQGSMCMANGPYLDPGSNPATGLFMKKLTTSPGCGVRMPQVTSIGYLTSAEMTCVTQWATALTMAAGGGSSTDGGAK